MVADGSVIASGGRAVSVRSFSIASGCSCALAGLLWTTSATPQAKQVVTPPKARYVMDVSTTSGLAGTDKGADASLSSGGGEHRELILRLGSIIPAGAPSADHFPPAALKAGKALMLMSPVRGRAFQAGAPGQPGGKDFQRPKSRMLIFWGCGEHAPKGQPVIIDFTKFAAGRMPPALTTVNVPVDSGPMASNSQSYGAWPNPRSNKQPGKGGTLIGEHRIAGNYTPEIRFTLDQDWMPALRGQSRALPGGAVGLSWNQIQPATGYYAWAAGVGGGMQGNQATDLVWWASSSSREFGGGLTDWLSPATVAGLIKRKVVMPPSQTSCTIPAEVKRAAPNFMMGNIYAYGPEASFVFPPRPESRRTPWIQLWAAKVRYRAWTMMTIGEPDMGAAIWEDDREPEPSKPRRARRR